MENVQANFTPLQLEALLFNIPTGCLLISKDSRVVYANPIAESTLKYSAGTLQNSALEDLLPGYVKHNHQSLTNSFFKEPTNRQMGTGKPLFAVCSDHSEIPVQIGLNPVQVDDEQLVLATILDISHQTRANQMLEQVISVAPHGVAVVNAEGKLILVNGAMSTAFGYTQPELLEMQIEDLIPQRNRSGHHKLRHDFTQAPTTKMMGEGRDLTALHKDGREFPVEIGLSPFVSLDNEDLVMVTLLDITHRKRMEMALRETNTNLEEFTYVASHDLRSPLRGISDLISWIEEDLGEDIPSEVKKNIDRVSVRVHRMEKLIDNLLAYARSGIKDGQTEMVDLNKMIRDINNLLAPPAHFTIIKDIKSEPIKTYKTPLETVIRNLLSNAIKHHDKPTGEITITSENEKDMMVITICDDGPGIPEAAIDRIFQLFQTVTSSERQHNGIGLSISRRLVETHGGTISVHNNASGTGCSFVIHWPRFLRKDKHE